MKKKKLALILLALSLALTTVLPASLAYFTTTTRAAGRHVLHFGSNTHIEEEFGNWTKHLVVSSEPVTEPSYVRARAFSIYDVTYVGDNWTPGGDGWLYYATPIANPGEGRPQPAGTTQSTSMLDVKISVPDLPEGEIPEGFDVTVVYETTPVRYNTEGAPYADWSRAAQTGGQEEVQG